MSTFNIPHKNGYVSLPFRLNVSSKISLSAGDPPQRGRVSQLGRDLPSPLFSTISFNFTVLTHPSVPAVIKKVLDTT